MSKQLVAVLFGGCSGEHEVSRNSAFTVSQALSHSYEVFNIGIAKDGQWYGPIPLGEIRGFTPDKFKGKTITILPNTSSGGTIYSLPALLPLAIADIFFPALHGTFGEDGTIQGLLELAGAPYVGCGVLASSVGMDKVMMKKIFAEAGLPQVPFLSFLRSETEANLSDVLQETESKLGYPCFVKPANLGSSVGISKASGREELEEAIRLACRYDRKIIIEKGAEVREIEVSVLGNENPRASVPGEIVPCNAFYDYKAKYIDDRSLLHIPAKIEESTAEKIRELAVKAYQAIDGSGLARVDFFLTKDTREVLINEINTLPGFTDISMYPKLWEHTGVGLTDLVRQLVELALERAADKKANVISYED
ncbi:MAG: D-alanine--D-alanine ligase family protein [Clostridia bacterium]|jgi:D-alanine-D-alanine ligase|nr:D-alanine--D-alanine ligase family protein [Clostridia bacterium]